MASFIVGQIVIVPFPFSDNSGVKKRPAFVIRDLPGQDLILCQITAQEYDSSPFIIKISNSDFSTGNLLNESYVRCEKIATIFKQKIIRSAGNLKPGKTTEIINKISNIIQSNV